MHQTRFQILRERVLDQQARENRKIYNLNRSKLRTIRGFDLDLSPIHIEIAKDNIAFCIEASNFGKIRGMLNSVSDGIILDGVISLMQEVIEESDRLTPTLLG